MGFVIGAVLVLALVVGLAMVANRRRRFPANSLTRTADPRGRVTEHNRENGLRNNGGGGH